MCKCFARARDNPTIYSIRLTALLLLLLLFTRFILSSIIILFFLLLLPFLLASTVPLFPQPAHRSLRCFDFNIYINIHLLIDRYLRPQLWRRFNYTYLAIFVSINNYNYRKRKHLPRLPPSHSILLQWECLVGGDWQCSLSKIYYTYCELLIMKNNFIQLALGFLCI